MKFLSVLTVIFINSSFANYDHVEPSSEANQAADAFYNGEFKVCGSSKRCVPFNQCTSPVEMKSNCEVYEKCCEMIHFNASSKPNECGIRSNQSLGGPVSDSDVSQFGEFPWMVGIFLKYVYSMSYVCGGSLIHPKIVLSSAHNVKNLNVISMRVRFGEWNIENTNEFLTHVDKAVNFIKLHENYNNKNMHNDIALLVLERPLQMAPHINLVCLPPQNFEIPDATKCFATGWGSRELSVNEKLTSILKKIELPIVSHERCENMLRRTKVGEDFILDASFLCAGGDYADTCIGDGGSPLVCEIPGKRGQYYQVGIVSWGIKCAEADVPGVYTNVAKYRDWIDEMIESFGY